MIIYEFTNVCLLIAGLLFEVEGYDCKPVNHTDKTAVATPTEHPNIVHNV